MRLNKQCVLITWLLFGVSVQPAVVLAQNRNASWVTDARGDAFWGQLARSPYTQNGSRGLIVYMLSYSECGNCIAFLRDFWESHKTRMQLREIFVPINQPSLLDEAADMALTRDPVRADAYYHRILVAPKVNSSPERKAALDQVVSFTTRANAFFAALGHIQDGYPTFLMRVRVGGEHRVVIVSGYGPDFARDLDRWVTAATQSDATYR